MASARPSCTVFLSYARANNGSGHITRLRDALQNEVRERTAWNDFRIFMDIGIEWGKQWDGVIDTSLSEVFFLIVIVTPGWMNSQSCAEEVEKFLTREQQLKRTDLILPIYLLE